MESLQWFVCLEVWPRKGDEVSLVSSMAEEAEHDLRHDEQHDADLEQHEAIVARHVEDQLERLLHAPQLVLEREIAVRKVELGAQLLVDAVGVRVVPDSIGLVEQVQDREALVARAYRGSAEGVQRLRG